jgi:hypothetical protein
MGLDGDSNAEISKSELQTSSFSIPVMALASIYLLICDFDCDAVCLGCKSTFPLIPLM